MTDATPHVAAATENALHVHWFDGASSRRFDATLWVSCDSVEVRAFEAESDGAISSEQQLLACESKAALRVPARIGNTPYRIEFLGGGVALCSDADGVERLFPWAVRRDWLARMERASWAVALALAGLLGGLYMAYQQVIPHLADMAASRIPRSAEAELGDLTMAALGSYGFKASRLEESEISSIRHDFDQLAVAAGLGNIAALEFRVHSPNALALPGGTVFVTDSMVKLFRKDRDALRAILAHELGHQARRDTLRHMLAASLSAVLVGVVAGDVSGVTALTAAIPALTYSLQFSRSVETEADAYAFELLQKTGHSPRDFARAIERIEAMQLCIALRIRDRAAADRAPGPMYEAYEDDDATLSASSATPERPPAWCVSDPAAYLVGRDAELDSLDMGGALSYLSTHPLHAERIEAARTAAEKLAVPATAGARQ